MAENSGFSTDWFRNWTDMQQKGWAAWTDAARGAMPGAAPAMPSMAAFSSQNDWMRMWQENMERWNPLLGAQQRDPMMGMGGAAGFPEIMSRLMAYGQGYTQFAELFFKSMTQLGTQASNLFSSAASTVDPADAMKQWGEAVTHGIEQMRRLLLSDTSGFAKGQTEWMSMWKHPMQGNWQEAVAAPAMQWMNFWQSIMVQPPKEFGMFDRSMNSFGEQMLSTPPIGITRELQEKWQTAGLYWMELQAQQKEYQAVLTRIGLLALEKMQQKLLNAASTDLKIDTLRKLYQIWVDSGEEAYAEIVTTREYQEVNSKWVNAMLRWKGHVQDMADQWLGSMGLPNRRELNNNHRRVTELKRSLRRIEERLDAMGDVARQKDPARDLAAVRDEIRNLQVDGLRDELASVKAELAELRALLAGMTVAEGEGVATDGTAGASLATSQAFKKVRRPGTGRGE
jgi:class III poly(R)-hydroxyalkanoic acid synthase PhaE subunit